MPILLGCVAGTVLLVAVFTLVTGRTTITRARHPVGTIRRTSAIGRLVPRLGLPASAGIGVHLATDRRAPGGPVPLRSALIGVSLAIVAIVGAAVVARSETAFAADPARWGRTWHSQPDAFGADSSRRAVRRALAAEPDVSAFATVASDEVRVNGRDVPVTAFTALHGRLQASAAARPTAPCH